MVLERWDPFRDSRRANRIVNRLWRGASFGSENGHWAVPLDVVRQDDGIVVLASLPGVDPKEIDVTIEDGALTIKGDTESDREESKEGYLLRERSTGRFYRALRLPDYVDTEKAEPSYENGVVSITFPYVEGKKAKRLEIKAA